ncbi:hypothetical protein AGMMS50225_01940 [Betaproteobacteria bacterium]|nr:hypothetical protein AGMMS50225_01940 [Betaproteobacteria bacterium]
MEEWYTNIQIIAAKMAGVSFIYVKSHHNSSDTDFLQWCKDADLYTGYHGLLIAAAGVEFYAIKRVEDGETLYLAKESDVKEWVEARQIEQKYWPLNKAGSANVGAKGTGGDMQELDTKSRKTALKIIGALMMDGYGMDIHAPKLEGLQDVLKGLAAAGVSVSERTLRDWIKDAAKEIEQLNPRKH